MKRLIINVLWALRQTGIEGRRHSWARICIWGTSRYPLTPWAEPTP